MISRAVRWLQYPAPRSWSIVVLGCCVVLGVLYGVQLGKTNATAEKAATALIQTQEGRRLALEISCSIQSAIAQAGREVIAGSPKPPPPAQERAIESLGFPVFKVRHAAAQKQGNAYVDSIRRRIYMHLRGVPNEQQIVDSLVHPGGSINCQKLESIARVGSHRAKTGH